MNLLIITQKVNKNDSNLGFFHSWILEFSRYCQKLTVICLEKGEYDLLNNVKVLSLGKEHNYSKLKYIVNFYKYIWQERKNYDAVFVHMNVEYIVLGGLLWRMLNKKIGLWYMHKSVTSKLKLAEKLVDIIFTGSKDSFRLKTKKLEILHHGIDSNLFSFKSRNINNPLKLLTVGRISKSKNIDLMIDLMVDLKNKIGVEPELKIIGSPIYDVDKIYLDFLKNKVKKVGLHNISFVGVVANTKLPPFYQEADIFLNFSDTGSVDKTVLEAMSCGSLVLVSNEAFKDILENINVLFYIENINQAADSVKQIIDIDSYDLRLSLHKYVEKNHDLSHLVKEIVNKFS